MLPFQYVINMKNLNEIFYTFLLLSEIWCAFTHITSQCGLYIFQVLNSNMWLVPPVLDGAVNRGSN